MEHFTQKPISPIYLYNFYTDHLKKISHNSCRWFLYKLAIIGSIIFLTVSLSIAQTTICFNVESETEEEIGTGLMSTTSSDLELGEDAGTPRLAGLRYTNFNVPSNVFVTNATIQFTADEVSNTMANLTIKGELADNATPYSSANFNVSSRATTSSSVNWQPQQWVNIGAVGLAQKTPDISNIITEIINNPAFISGNAISFIISGTGTRTAINAPIDLCLTYTTCGTAGQSCDDNLACTINDVWDNNCNCSGTPGIDTDNDGICDAEDQCPNFDNNLIGTMCDDNNANTINDSWQLSCTCLGQPFASIRINEILTSNQGGTTNLFDEDGDSPDYIELYNTENIAIDLSNWKLLDGDNIWKIPAGTTINPNSFLSIWASGKDRSTPQLHSNFELNSNGEYLGLYDNFDNLIDDFGLAYPPQSDNISYGYTTGDALSYFNTITKNANNTNAISGKVATPQAANGRGFYTSNINETLSTATPNAEIRYTTDGRNPTNSSTLYSGSITINPDPTGIYTIRAKAFASGYEDSEEVSWSYVFPNALYNGLAAEGLKSLPVISVQTNSQTYPAQSRITTNVEMIETDASKTGFSVIAGVNEFGESSVNFSKSSFRLFFDNEFGVSDLEYDIFDGYGQGFIKPTKKFDKLELRGMSWDGWQGSAYFPKDYYITDRWWKDSRLDMGELNPHGRYANLFVNGEYRGVYQIRERLDHQFYASYTKEPAENFEALKYNFGNLNYINGNGTVYNSLNQNYQSVKNKVNAKSLIHFTMMMSLTWRSPESEYRGIGSADPQSKNGYIFNHNDNDFMFKTYFDFGGYSPGFHIGDLPFFNTYKTDPEFLQDVYEETAKHFCGDGAMTINKMVERLEYWEGEIDLSIYSEAIRWQGQSLDGSIPNTNTGMYNYWRNNMTSIKNRMKSSTGNLYSAWAAQGLYNGCDLRPEVDTENQISEINTAVSYVMDAIDPDGDAMNFASTTLPPGLSINSNTGEIFGTPNQLGTFNVTVRVGDTNNKWGNHNFVWEVINLNQLTGGQLIINEIHYNPLDSILASGGNIDDDNFEFIEVKNIGTADVILLGNVFTKGINLSLANPLIISPDSFAVFAKDSCWFEAKYGFFPDAVYSDKLNNGGEYLRLKDPYKNILDSLTYDDTVAWDTIPDNSQYSIAYIPGSTNTSDPANWAAQSVYNTPRAENIFCTPINNTITKADVSCPGSADGFIVVNPSGNNAPFTYLWNNGQNTSDINSLAPGTYTVTIKDTFQCELIDSVTIAEPDVLQINMTTTNESYFQTNDGMANTNLTGGTPPYSYSWSNGASTASIDNLAPGDYTLTISDASNCTAIETATINPIICTTFNVQVDQQEVTCFGDNNGALNISIIENGLAPYSISWSNGRTGTANSNLQAGNYTLSLTDHVGCTFQNNYMVNGPQDISATVNITDTNSGTNNGLIDVTVIGGTPPYSYYWSTAATTEDIANLPIGAYWLSITDSNNCNFTITNLQVNDSCVPSLTQLDRSTIANGIVQVGQFIQSNGIVPAGNIVEYKASNYIELQNHFEVIIGAEFYADIEGCQ